MEPYPSGQFGFIDDPDRQFGNGSVWTRTRTRSDGPEPLLTLVMAELHGFKLSLLSIEEKYESPRVVYLLEGHMYFDNILLYYNGAAKLAVDMAISLP